MRRWLGVVVVAALVAVLYPRAAFSFQQPTTQPFSDDLSVQLFQRVFSESEPPEAHFSIDRLADRLSASFFHNYALRVAVDPAGSGMAQVMIPPVSLTLVSPNLFNSPAPSGNDVTQVNPSEFRAPAIATPDSVVVDPSVEPPPVIGLYRDAAPAPTSGPASFRFDLSDSNAKSSLVTLNPTLNPQEAFSAGAAEPDQATALPQAQAGVAVGVRLGHVHLQPHVEGAQADVPSLALRDNAVNTGATFNTRVGPQKFDIDVSSGFEHMTVNDPTLSSQSFDPTSNMQIGQGNLPVLVPAYADVSKHSLAAGVGVPVARNVTVNVQAETQHLQGGYGSPGVSNLDARNDIYGGNVTFQLPHAASVSLSAKQYRYQDNLSPTTFTQTSANLNFTVKFKAQSHQTLPFDK